MPKNLVPHIFYQKRVSIYGGTIRLRRTNTKVYNKGLARTEAENRNQLLTESIMHAILRILELSKQEQSTLYKTYDVKDYRTLSESKLLFCTCSQLA
jgi:hypothetical protein